MHDSSARQRQPTCSNEKVASNVIVDTPRRLRLVAGSEAAYQQLGIVFDPARMPRRLASLGRVEEMGR